MAIESSADQKLESAGVSTRGVLLAGLGFLLLLALANGAIQAIYYRQVPVQKYPVPEQFPLPRVQTGQVQQLRRLETEQTKRLTGYHWVDRKHGLVQIPIERAMQLLAGEGVRAYAPLAPAQALSSPTAGAERAITPQAGPPTGAPTTASPPPPSTPAPAGSGARSKPQPPAAGAATATGASDGATPSAPGADGPAAKAQGHKP